MTKTCSRCKNNMVKKSHTNKKTMATKFFYVCERCGYLEVYKKIQSDGTIRYKKYVGNKKPEKKTLERVGLLKFLDRLEERKEIKNR